MTSTPTDPTPTLVQLQQANAALRQERDAALAREAALADVLGVINASPDDPASVFDSILEHAHRLCGAAMGALNIYTNGHFMAMATQGYPDHLVAMIRQPFAPTASSQALLEGARYIHVSDLRLSEARHTNDIVRTLVEQGQVRTQILMPLRNQDQFLGFLTANRQEVRPFTDPEITLLENFAAQAVIAMENARLITEQRKALERQTATADILGVISTSLGDVQPVFEKILESCKKIFRGELLSLSRVDEQGQLQLAAWLGAHREEVAATFPAPVELTPAGRAIREGRVVHYPDVLRNPDTPLVMRRMGEVYGIQSAIFAPMLWQGRGIGAVGVGRASGAFTDREMEVLQTFAAQAVIAIENARLLGELQERTAALAARNSEFGERIEQQAATIDVLKVMSSTPDNTEPVFDLIVRRATELCNGTAAGLFEFDGALVHFRALHHRDGEGFDAASLKTYTDAFPMVPIRGSISCRAILDKQVVHIRDTEADPELSMVVRNVLKEVQRSQVSIPLMRDGKAIGAIALGAAKPGGFTDSQIALLQTFAEQAVIAIGTVATYRQLQERTAALALRNSEFGERIEQQSATIDVLKVMSSTPDDTGPVFELITRRARELCIPRLIENPHLPLANRP